MLRTPGRSGPKYLYKIDIVAVFPHSSVQLSDVRTKPVIGKRVSVTTRDASNGGTP